jgi:hypothetical protein
MTGLLCALLLQSAPGYELERNVQRVLVDVLGRSRELRFRERVIVRGADVAFQDLTFGERRILQASRRRLLLVDPLQDRYSELTFEQVAALRRTVFDGIRAARARVPGTPDDQALGALLEAFDEDGAAAPAELKATGTKREILLGGDRVRVAVDVDPAAKAEGWFSALAAAAAFPAAVASKLSGLGGVPVRGTMRYVLLLDRVTDRFETIRSGARDVADAEFEVPKGYRKSPWPGVERPSEAAPPKPGVLKKDFKEDDPPKKGSP